MQVSFASESDLKHFISKDADHWWYLESKPYYGKVIDKCTIQFSSCFGELIKSKQNQAILFGRKEIKEKMAYIPYDPQPQIISL